MTIRAFRIFLEYENKTVARHMNRTHFGVADWASKHRLNQRRKELGGPEVKGVNIVNVHFFDEEARCSMPCGTWYRRFNAIEFNLVYDMKSLLEREPIDNLTMLLPVAATLCLSALWPQVRAVGRALEPELTAEEMVTLKAALGEWTRLVDGAGRLN